MPAILWVLAGWLAVSVSALAEPPPVVIGIDAEFGHTTATSAEAVRRGVLIAIDEINRAGGVLGGRKLAIETTDNRSVPARGVQNLRDLAARPEVIAVFTGKFSPVVLEQAPVASSLGIPLLDPWAAADGIVDAKIENNFVYRLSLTDSWALEAMMRHAQRRGISRLGLMLPNTGWGRSSLKAAQKFAAENPSASLARIVWYNWGDKTMLPGYREMQEAGAKAVILVANETEGSILVRELAALPATDRLPVISHWGVTGGEFVKLCGPALQQVDFSVVQTYSFIGAQDEHALRVLAAARRLFGVADARRLESPVGVAHAYDLTHLLAAAINKAGKAERAAVRAALEQIGSHDGLLRKYTPPFTRSRHEALGPELVFMAKYDRDGAIVRISER